MNSIEVLEYWFKELGPKGWFAVSSQIDRKIKDLFLQTHQAASAGALFKWRETAHGRLAEIIVLDQFSRNIFRNSPEAFATDGMALILAQTAVEGGFDRVLTPTEKSFLYMPFMHSESLAIHEVAVQLFSQTGLENNLNFELRHKSIIEKFGRYPHRNAILNRVSSADEIEFLKQPGSSF